MPIRILFVAIGIFFFIIIILIIKGILANPLVNKTAYYSMLKEQNQILHVTSLDTAAAQQQGTITASAQNFTANTQIVLSAEITQNINYFKKDGTTVSPTKLAKIYSPAVDSELSQATTNGDFNAVYSSVLDDEISAYEADLKEVYNSARQNALKSILSSDYKSAVLLKEQLNTTVG